MKKFYLLILCAFKLMSSWAQDYTMDSLKHALSGSTTDISKITALDNLSDFYYNGYAWIDLKKKDTSFRLLNQAIGLAEKNKMTEKEEELLKKLALLYYSSNTNQKGSILPTAAKGLALAKSANLKAWEPIFEGLAALGYFSTGKRTDSAILLMSQGLDFARKNHMPAEEATLLDYFGTAYSDSYPDSAGLLLRQALSLAEANKLTTQEIDVLRHLANLYGDRKHDSAMMWIHQALSLARQNDLSKTAISIFYSLLGTWSPLYENDSLEGHFTLGSQLAQQIHAQHAEADFLNDYGGVYDKRGNYTIALTAYLKALEIQQQIDDKYGMASVLYNIGILYLNVQDYPQSLQYLARANEETRGIKDSFNFVFSLEGIGENYVNLKKYDSARIFAQKAYNFGNFFYTGHIYGGLLNNLGRIYAELGDDSLAMLYFRQSFPNFNPSNEDENICESLMGMATLFKKSGREDSAFYYAAKTFPIAKKNNFLQYLLDAGNLLAEHYKRIHEIDSAFRFQEIALAAHDSLYSREKITALERINFDNQLQQQALKQKLLETRFKYQSRLKTYIMLGGLLVFFILAIGLWRRNVYRQKAFAALDRQNKIIDMQKNKVEQALEELKSLQSQLIQSEKMASLGTLTAGIAHEIENPLNFVNNFSEVNRELIEELESELGAGHHEAAILISKYISENEQKIIYHGKRADAIVKGMLQHSRLSTGIKEPADINALADEYLRLAYHGSKAKDKAFHATIKTDFDTRIKKINIIPQDTGRVLLNLYNNSFYAVAKKKKKQPDDYEPEILVSTKWIGDKIEIHVKDNGGGIPQKVLGKIFQPFFTTKPAGEGTGLGLSLSYDIVKAHGGEIKVETKEGEGSEFIVQLPANNGI